MDRLERAGLVLAAGFGSRLAQGTARTSLKPLTPVHGVPLFVRTLRSLRRAGCSRAVVVLGHAADAIRATMESALELALPVEYVTNPRFDLKNGVSVLAAREQVGEEFVLTMADHVFGRDVLEVAAAHRPAAGAASLLVDYKLDAIFDIDDATKVQAEDGKVLEIGKQLPQFNCVDTGLFVCTRALLFELEAVVRAQGDASLSDGVARLARAGKMAAIDIGGGFWQDVDTPEMLAHAERRWSELE
jgi:1L-myo-inositol 1-phosphate cytidylyltransferase